VVWGYAAQLIEFCWGAAYHTLSVVSQFPSALDLFLWINLATACIAAMHTRLLGGKKKGGVVQFALTDKHPGQTRAGAGGAIVPVGGQANNLAHIEIEVTWVCFNEGHS
jgi:hypothetical protein